jgi:hypothetical protein
VLNAGKRKKPDMMELDTYTIYFTAEDGSLAKTQGRAKAVEVIEKIFKRTEMTFNAPRAGSTFAAKLRSQQ